MSALRRQLQYEKGSCRDVCLLTVQHIRLSAVVLVAYSPFILIARH